ncbi:MULTISPECIES: glutamine--tRNA ligase/YqeY domain fusion protein [Butyricimonas]|jgi:glutaminyl-tRNA synthetase|uniref:Glutamine--tRNA ligase n=1 Tax=Butyricimonas faecihominis TaxID=1472416 RepID=A0A7W6N0C0_9BACT|nr:MULTISPECIES: glutamine--tRNA ligase/YqeY domain fusion protein [Butyricimonas]MBS6686750.1 glutamine--tRNA ligase/YqeY domain fusion protein [Sanguibacteroides justesenii]KAB1505533.1 glutamine--tRNA ligase/YqeY domain fusion protein [Butyricimonas faecihominis]MBB4027697.1 glutaminyl-tRNA synthetase [Butyricimonas faecihominis]WOF07232.1 glutamine--tRNA ligase/YqeY domain fusion protein [Butyricimonas faecihominis]BEI56752.1 glutamine--tRNA ligase/YqeY domain fusion protein [Butyricimonas
MDKNHLVEEEGEGKSLNFIEQIIEEELAEGKNGGRVHTRFPPEPNGYLHIGHATSICLNFGLATEYHGKCNLRFDDTNPSKEDVEYIDSIQQDIQWLGFQWEGEPHFASDYFQQLYDWAEKLILEGKAYVDDQPAEVISAQRMTPTEPGVNSPYRDRTPEENLDLFRRMKSGEFQAGEKVLRAKIDMASSNMLMRDPIMYRIMHVAHHRTGDKWCIYPMYDFTHGQSDYLEGITHSICTLEFEVHRPLYNWFLDQLIDTEYRPRQIEFARRNLSYTVMSKRRLLELVQKGIVAGWDDPRMPTITGLRRAGYTPESIRNFAEKVGVARREIVVDMALLEFCVREHLNKIAPRVMAVLDPVRVVIDNYPEGQTETVEIENNPEDETAGTRMVPFSRELYIERDDFMEDAPKKFFRMTLGNEVRLKGAYIVKCESVEKDAEGNITTIHCTYDADTRSGTGSASNRKVKGTLHWVSAPDAIEAEVRLYDRLFKDPDPAGHKDIDFKEFLNENSLKVLTGCKLEPSLKEAKEGDRFQFQRLGYFCVDKDSKPGALVFNRTVGLKDTWAKQNN